ncbi:Uncharacterised protein [BD1-7 clade bacterium]|uniref:Uncharacterized protein n=1 Tax=BD1-7 clade bacterium TaxID=2029982 RepID=A0A5S9PJW6_9GAMM|nr:Uncharacterised protein [BD1-7 clade bacterium]CAA0104260.1 Uncharacterised protein [BD1-7 clade bacterium]
MNKYNPSQKIDPNEWLNLSEHDRMDLVRDFHESLDEDMPDDAMELHAAFHVIVENQLAEEVELIPETIAKLTRQGLDRHEAIHAIAAIVSEDIFDLWKGNKTEFSPKQYRRKLEKITAKRWKKGQY